MKKPLFIFTILLLVSQFTGKGQTALIQTSHLPQNPAAYLCELSVACHDSGAFIIGTKQPGNYPAVKSQRTISKIDKFGNPVWQKHLQFRTSQTYYSENITAACTTLRNGVLLCGRIGNGPAMAVCTNSNGNVIWYKSLALQDTSGVFEIKTVMACRDSGYVVAGSFGWDIALMRLDKNGNTLWSAWEKNTNELFSMLSCLLEASDSSIYAGGKYMVNENDNKSYPLLLKFKNDGSLLWKKAYPPSANGFSKGATFTSLLQRGNTLNACVDDGSPFIAALKMDGSVGWTKKVNTQYSYSVLDCKSRSLTQIGANQLFATYGTYLFSCDTSGQLIYFHESHNRYAGTSPLLNNRFLQIEPADFFSSDIPEHSIAYTLTLNNSAVPEKNRCFSLAPYPVSDFSMRDSLLTSAMVNSLTTFPEQMYATGTFSTLIMSGCNLLAGIADSYSSPLEISVFPNPSKGSFFLSRNNEEVKSVVLCRADGRVVHSQYFSTEDHSLEINPGRCSPGLYFCKITFQNGSSKIVRLILED